MRAEREPGDREIPRIPPKGQRIRLLIDSDAKNEIDDQWAIALAILSPERFGIEGFIGANFDNSRGGSDGIEKSVNGIELILTALWKNRSSSSDHKAFALLYSKLKNHYGGQP